MWRCWLGRGCCLSFWRVGIFFFLFYPLLHILPLLLRSLNLVWASHPLSLYSWSFQVLVLLFHPVHRLLEGKSLTPNVSQICSAASENENTILGAFNSWNWAVRDFSDNFFAADLFSMHSIPNNAHIPIFGVGIGYSQIKETRPRGFSSLDPWFTTQRAHCDAQRMILCWFLELANSTKKSYQTHKDLLKHE